MQENEETQPEHGTLIALLLTPDDYDLLVRRVHGFRPGSVKKLREYIRLLSAVSAPNHLPYDFVHLRLKQPKDQNPVDEE